MTLKQKRAEWEKGLMPQLVVSELEHGYPVVRVLAVSAKDLTNWHLHRYMPVGNSWEVSVDKRGTIHECLECLQGAFEALNRIVEKTFNDATKVGQPESLRNLADAG